MNPFEVSWARWDRDARRWIRWNRDDAPWMPMDDSLAWWEWNDESWTWWTWDRRAWHDSREDRNDWKHWHDYRWHASVWFHNSHFRNSWFDDVHMHSVEWQSTRFEMSKFSGRFTHMRFAGCHFSDSQFYDAFSHGFMFFTHSHFERSRFHMIEGWRVHFHGCEMTNFNWHCESCRRLEFSYCRWEYGWMKGRYHFLSWEDTTTRDLEWHTTAVARLETYHTFMRDWTMHRFSVWEWDRRTCNERFDSVHEFCRRNPSHLHCLHYRLWWPEFWECHYGDRQMWWWRWRGHWPSFEDFDHFDHRFSLDYKDSGFKFDYWRDQRFHYWDRSRTRFYQRGYWPWMVNSEHCRMYMDSFGRDHSFVTWGFRNRDRTYNRWFHGMDERMRRGWFWWSRDHAKWRMDSQFDDYWWCFQRA